MSGRIVGIIAEYNPFHNGHLYHLKRALELTGASGSVAVMSGNFVQRGEPAIIDKWRRAETAVRNGVDLVLELPFLYATGSAEYFASGAVRLLDSLGPVTHLAFGCEEGALAPLEGAARVLAAEPPRFKAALRVALKAGKSFPRARAEALRLEAGEAAARLLDLPNNIMAIEYLKRLMLEGGRIEPVAVKRAGAGYFGADPGSRVAGASVVRGLALSGRADEAARYLPGREDLSAPQSPDLYFTLIAAVAALRGREGLSEVVSASEGVENRLIKALDRAYDMTSLVAAVKSARYTETRIRRFLLHALFGLTREKFDRLDAAWPGYARALAFSEKGRGILRLVKARAGVPVITNPNKRKPEPPASEIFELDALASDIYNLIGSGSTRERSDYRMRPFVSSG